MSSRSADRSRRFAIGVAGWVFGLASTVLLVGVWGRAMVTDTDQLAESLTPLAASDAVAERISTWLESELVGTGLDGPGASIAADQVLTHPRVGPLLEELVAEGVEAAASDDPAGASLDVAAILVPATGQITSGLNDAGVPVTSAQVETALASLDPLVIREPSDRPFVGASSPLASNLGTAAMLGLVLMMLAGSAYVAMSRDRMRAVRSLLTRFALGALSFAVLLRIGAWLVDPEGGRAPFRESFALLADSKWIVPMNFGLVSLGAAVIARMLRRRVRPGAGSRSGHEPPIHQGA
ncbi:MAG TPA: hypothetical protein VK990_08750 [Acidimicrobiia bacterium]|nr:hypothetical protein [Acidimicrobiia bacterium]